MISNEIVEYGIDLFIYLSERFFCVYFSKFSPVALIESVTMSISIPNCLLVLYVKTLTERFSVFIFQNFRWWHFLKVLQ